MPRWRALPEELDPQVREFTEQLRRLVERSGLSISAVADRTGYSKTSWERYLNGRLLSPRGAAEALAEVTGTDVGHLSTMWELAERAWSRSELRHDVTLEAMRVARARAALGEFGPPPAARAGAGAREQGALRSEPLCREPRLPDPRPPDRPEAVAEGIRAAPAVPAAQAPAPRPPVPRAPVPPDYRASAIPAPAPGAPRRRVGLFVTGVVGALLVVAAAVLLLGTGDRGADGDTAAVTPSASTVANLPAGVKCAGAGCAGKDPEAMGCGGARATTAGSATVGSSYVEVRYSAVCGAAWGRITRAAVGDAVRISARAQGSAPARTESGRVVRDADGYTPMVAVAAPGQATACATLAAGPQGCTVPRAASPGTAG
ncbi:membrane protein [Streptomyces albireticuli]|uniref:Membrane protein n=1 Tax=Streptomyces albireticuli TaxID=1940 RepID=A0A1Z2L237_9ACTN|nr:XRE family transcriptional regulator [Streptomyces albireticuli]ARZ68338.1 membrane protein [Streptomyces albireticuli]